MSILNEFLGRLDSGKLRMLDLTKPLGPETPVIGLPPPFAEAPPFSMENVARYDENGPNWYWNAIHLGEHTGTHFDAPIHWITGKDLPDNSCDRIPVRRLLGAACVFDASEEAGHQPDLLVTEQDLLRWEERHGRIPSSSWVLLRTDWSKRLNTEFLNADEKGAHSPGFHPQACRFLVESRDILGIGVESVGIDAGQADKFKPPFPNHATILGAGKFGLASLCNLDQLRPTGAVVLAAPLRIVQGSGSPARVVAFVPTEKE